MEHATKDFCLYLSAGVCTTHWIECYPVKHRAGISGLGKIHLGLFTGSKDFRLFANGIPLVKQENHSELWGTNDLE